MSEEVMTLNPKRLRKMSLKQLKRLRDSELNRMYAASAKANKWRKRMLQKEHNEKHLSWLISERMKGQ